MSAASPSLSPGRRAWRRFRANRLGFWSLVLFCTLVVISLAAELVSNDRPLIVRYQGQTYFPMLKDYPETTFGGDFQTPADYLAANLAATGGATAGAGAVVAGVTERCVLWPGAVVGTGEVLREAIRTSAGRTVLVR